MSINRIVELNQYINESKNTMDESSTPLQGKSQAAVKREAIALSKRNKGMYVIVYVDFGEAFAMMNKRLNVFSPSDSTYDWYVHNGKVKKFSGNQKVADQNATPQMN